ncbi:MAG: hypothetical protein PHO20_04430 [Candidatus Peribacteraceae bacterium]|nr:hypothetical protein [Candidatus Peribacteraceae bacterium]MDD5739987.1 hypothetical protein [Candidatus Peribacteraceae bacterium]
MLTTDAPGHTLVFVATYILGVVVIVIFGGKLSKQLVKFISGLLFFVAAVLGMSTQNAALVNLVGSNVDIGLTAILAAAWGWMLQVASPH